MLTHLTQLLIIAQPAGNTFEFWDRPQQFFFGEFRNGLREARAEIVTKVKNGQLRNSLWMEK